VQFLLNVIDDQNESASGDEMAAIDAFNESLEASGFWIRAHGIHSPSDSIVFDNRRGAGQVKLGPLIENPEFISGFWLIEVPDRSTAERLAAEGSHACNRKVELRQLH
jgi:hypothetical protein